MSNINLYESIINTELKNKNKTNWMRLNVLIKNQWKL